MILGVQDGKIEEAGAAKLFSEAAAILIEAAREEPDVSQLHLRLPRFIQRNRSLSGFFIVTRVPEAAGVSPFDYILWAARIPEKEPYFAISHEHLLPEMAHKGDRETKPSLSIAPGSPLSRSQQKGLAKLQGFYHVKQRAERIAGVAARPIPLIVGPSGSGKTHLIGEFARQKSLPLFDCNFGTWNVTGSHNQNTTLKQIAEFMRQHERGLVFIDEVDKVNGTSDWARSVSQEIYALLDGRMESFDTWTHEEMDKFRKHFFLVGAGTWQSLHTENQKTVGFHHEEGEVSGKIDLNRQTSIESELLYRFNADIVHLDPPGAEEFREKIVQIRKELNIRPLAPEQLRKLVDRAVASRKHHRFLEAYVSHLLAKEVRQPQLGLEG